MIKLNGKNIELGAFPDGTMLLKQEPPLGKEAEIAWFYESDRETMALLYLARHLQAHGIESLQLYMPYIPNARQDRVKGNEDVFTLKYFAQLINDLGFKTVRVLDPHSVVSEALFHGIEIQSPKPLIEEVIKEIEKQEGAQPFLFYPDEGAGKRYSGMISLPYGFGIKKRDWETGCILGLDLSCDEKMIAGKNILIVDDICSRGGTFYHAAKRLKELQVNHIYLYVSHCENTILEGDLPQSGLIQKVYTTNSIFTRQDDWIHVFEL